MKILPKLIALAAVVGISTAMLLSFGGAAQADCYQYNPNGFVTSATPVFNNICGAPEGVNDESNFVRIRQDSNGNDEDNNNNPAYTVGTLSAACNNGDEFDVWNYLHNDATSDDNDNGSGSAVAHNVQTLMTAPIGSTNNQFTFGDTISASNAASVQDSATLNCGNNQVQLSLVPGTVHIYSIPYAAWLNLPDSSINHATTLGSPTFGSGDMWGCWNYRMVIVYQVKVTAIPTPPAPAFACTDLGLTAENNRTVKVSTFTTTQSGGASFDNVVINWGDNSTPLTTSSPVGQTHEYSATGNASDTYQVTATAYFNVPGQSQPQAATSASCTQPVTFTTSPTPPSSSTPQPPVTTTTTSAPAAPTALVNTGPGSVLGIFAAATIGGMALYRRLLARRLARQ